MEQITLEIDAKTRAVLDEIQLRFGHDPEQLLGRMMSYMSNLYVKNQMQAKWLISKVMKG